MKVVLKKTVTEGIQNELQKARVSRRDVERIELTAEEYRRDAEVHPFPPALPRVITPGFKGTYFGEAVHVVREDY